MNAVAAWIAALLLGAGIAGHAQETNRADSGKGLTVSEEELKAFFSDAKSNQTLKAFLEEREKKNEVFIKGVLLTGDNSPAAKRTVFILKSTGAGQMELGGLKGGLSGLSVNAETASNGAFTVTASRQLLAETNAVLCVFEGAISTFDIGKIMDIVPQYPKGVPVLVRPPHDANVVDLGMVVITGKDGHPVTPQKPSLINP